MQHTDRFRSAIERFDEANSADPNREDYQGAARPRELVYAWRMTAWLERLAPEASEALRLAARCQHIRRWTIARESYPTGRRGYLQWRSVLADFHAEQAGVILRDAGYGAELIVRVQDLLRKRNLPTDHEAQMLEDVVCLVFLESYFADFLKKHDQDRTVGIIRKTWAKMSARARQEALNLPLPPAARLLIERAQSHDP